MSELVTLKSKEGWEVNSLEQDGKTWFVAKDVCDILELKNVADAVENLYEDEKNIIAMDDNNTRKRGKPGVIIINEPGLYRLVFRCRKSEKAKAFQNWIIKEILPFHNKFTRDAIYKEAFEEIKAEFEECKRLYHEIFLMGLPESGAEMQTRLYGADLTLGGKVFIHKDKGIHRAVCYDANGNAKSKFDVKSKVRMWRIVELGLKGTGLGYLDWTNVPGVSSTYIADRKQICTEVLAFQVVDWFLKKQYPKGTTALSDSAGRAMWLKKTYFPLIDNVSTMSTLENAIEEEIKEPRVKEKRTLLLPEGRKPNRKPKALPPYNYVAQSKEEFAAHVYPEADENVITFTDKELRKIVRIEKILEKREKENVGQGRVKHVWEVRDEKEKAELEAMKAAKAVANVPVESVWEKREREANDPKFSTYKNEHIWERRDREEAERQLRRRRKSCS